MSEIDRTDELIALAAMGELDADEERELDALAADDASVVAELDDALDVAARIQSAFAITPPSGLRDSVLHAVASVGQDAAWDPPESNPVAQIGTERRRRRPITFLAAAAALLLVVGVGSVFVFGRDAQPDDIAAVQSADDAVVRQLQGELSGSLQVIHSPGEDAIVIDGDGLPALGADRVFVLWAIADSDATAVVEFGPDDDGSVSIRIDDIDPEGSTLGVTEETIGQVDSPTDPILARG